MLPPPPRGGPLLAICGLRAGDGATTLAYLVAAMASESWRAPVLLCDAGGGDLAGLAGAIAPLSLAGAAAALTHGEPLAGGLFGSGRGGLRVIARPEPDPEQAPVSAMLAQLLHDARLAHALTVVDAGRLERPVEQAVLRAATHVAWVMAGAELDAAAAAPALARAAGGVSARWPPRELVLVRAAPAGPQPPLGELIELSGQRGGPLVLMPMLADPHKTRADDAASVTLTALLGWLRR